MRFLFCFVFCLIKILFKIHNHTHKQKRWIYSSVFKIASCYLGMVAAFHVKRQHTERKIRLQTSLTCFLYTSPPHIKIIVIKITLAHLQFLLFSTFSPSVFHSRFPQLWRTPWLFKRKWRTCISSSSRCFGFVFENAIPPPCDDCEKHHHGRFRAGQHLFNFGPLENKIDRV